MNFDFQQYVDVRKNPHKKRSEHGEFGEYAYSSDIRILRTLSHAKPVRLAVEASVRAFKAWHRSDILGRSVRVSARQFPRLYEIVAECAERLHIPVPVVYVTQDFSNINAGTYGTESDSFILMSSATVDRLTDDQLRFVIGHECGHIQNSHVTYGTALKYLTTMSAIFVRWIVKPAEIALLGWSRRAEITCDRAGLLCCGDLKVATETFVKLAVGSQRLTEEIDLDAYLEQLEDIRDGIGRVSEYFMSHPYLPKRVRSLQLFAESEYYRRTIGKKGGTALSDVDKQVDEVISVL